MIDLVSGRELHTNEHKKLLKLNQSKTRFWTHSFNKKETAQMFIGVEVTFNACNSIDSCENEQISNIKFD